jgi:tRNA 5-methylaminomethyl-2-thiouridine biosynthesis bifunctional protein
VSKPFVPIQTAEIRWIQNLPFSLHYNDIYYSIDSGLNQSRYVFIDGNDLINRWSALPVDEPSTFCIGETGFGTGLNFLLTWSLWERHAPSSAQLHFISCELHPFKQEDLIRALSNWPELEPYLSELITHYPVLTPGVHHLSFADGRVKLTLMLGDAFECFESLLLCGDALLETQLRGAFIDAWYLDGFAPKKNESTWTKALLQVIAMLSGVGTTFATYTAASSVKSVLLECGFEWHKTKGYGPKRHMLTGFLSKREPYRLKQRSTPWHIAKSYPVKEKSALIIGAGLAGCYTAHSLAQRGWRVTVCEARDSMAQGASGIKQAVLFPKLSAFDSPLTEFMLSAFLYAHRIYKALLTNHPALGELNGALTLLYNLKEQKAQQSLDIWLSFYPELGELITVERASILTGINMSSGGLYIPYSGWIDSPGLCRHLLEHDRISLRTQMTVSELLHEDGMWRVGDHSAPVLVLANGNKINQFKETQHIPIKPIRGQMTSISSSAESEPLKIPLCAEGHVLPANNGMHLLGATYDQGVSDALIKPDDDVLNLEKLGHGSEGACWDKTVQGHWSGVRASTPDYLPVIGPIAQAESFTRVYAGLESNSKRWIPQEASYYPGLYACAGFGSRGLTTVPLAVEWLCGLINQELSAAPRRLVQALAPARFLRRDITRGKVLNL